MKKFIVFFMALVLATPTYAGEILWGVTNGTGDAGFWTGGQIFTVDTATGAVDVKATYGTNLGIYALGDIAVSQSGEVYVTYYGADGFDMFAKVNTSTWGFDFVQDLGGWNDQVNALNFIGNDLYGVTGGGIPADLLRFDLSGGGVTVTNLGNIGSNSDGDIAQDRTTGDVYYTSWETGSLGDLKTIALDPPSTLTTVQTDYSGWAGLEFTNDGTLWAGTYWDQNLYILNKSTGTSSVAWDLSGALGGNITGLSTQVIPAPGAIVLAGMGTVVVGWLRRRKSL